ncbi:archaetidylserine decarboxylase [Methylomagnum ishizawai]|uniref:archaetidylserine decarboxylase n=1 Tax=Methylomagnum ishizawai TaxID=1760988 RepID=UPI001C32C0E2|nr:archaetidylserine decarboxylase [Methylomagnum ishizawai]BBL74097.1 phosphatidylserine decarboxylase proenzyme [Methylomagnum ishizawai]
MPLRETLFSLLQYPLPHHALSRLMHHLTRCENRAWKDAFIRRIIQLYRVDMAEALQPDPAAYPSFNAFFTRALKPDARPLCPDPDAVLCPADGAISQIGDIEAGSIFQAKGKSYTATELLGGDPARAAAFQNGKFATVYLSPRDYHRLHMPLAGTLREMVHVPGRLFSVNNATARQVPNLFARNERVAAIFETEAGPMALVLVGAIFVASIETVWQGVVTPPAGTTVRTWDYRDTPVRLERGQEMGRFNMGSTIIVLFGENAVDWEALAHGDKVKMGGILGRRPPVAVASP